MLEKLGFWGLTTIGSLIVGIISYFLKRTMSRVDKNDECIILVRENYIKKSEYEKGQDEQNKEIVKIRENYTPKTTHEKDYDELRKDIKDMKDTMLKKDDFLREMNKVERQIEKNQEQTNKLLLKYFGGDRNE